MVNYFGLPIIVAIGLGIIFPYIAFQLIPVSIAFLFLLMYCAGLTIDWKNLSYRQILSPAIIIGLLFSFVLLPFAQWIIARQVISDSQYLYGLVLASLCPAAVVAPFFVRSVDADENVSFILIVVTMILFPFVAPVVLNVLLDHDVYFNREPIAKYMLLLTTLPVLLGYLTYRFIGKIPDRRMNWAGVFNMLCLSFLIFILFGNATRSINLNYIDFNDIALLLLMVFIQNFVVLHICKLIFLKVYSVELAMSMAITLSMRNYAVAAGILLYYDPRASIAPALGFVAHAILFNLIYLARKTKYFRPVSG